MLLVFCGVVVIWLSFLPRPSQIHARGKEKRERKKLRKVEGGRKKGFIFPIFEILLFERHDLADKLISDINTLQMLISIDYSKPLLAVVLLAK